MRTKNNEKGYALLMVLMLVLLFTTLGMGLLTMNMNASKQFSNKEEQVQARHLAEMGVLHYKSKVESIITTHDRKTGLSCDNFPLEINEPMDENAGKYIVERLTTPDDKSCVSSDKEVIITINSKGEVDLNGKVKEIEAKIHILNNGDNSSETSMPETGKIVTTTPTSANFSTSDEYKIGTAINIWSNKKWEFKNSFSMINGTVGGTNYDTTNLSVWGNFLATAPLEVGRGYADRTVLAIGGDFIVKDVLIISGNNDSKPSISVGKDMYVDGSLTVGDTKCMVVYGDAHFKSKPLGRGEIYVVGNTMINGINQNNAYKPPSNFDYTNCPKPPSLSKEKEYDWNVLPELNAEYIK